MKIIKSRYLPAGDKCPQWETSPKGITLITLAITIVIMIIIAGVSISVGGDLMESSRVTRFDSELRIIHTKVNEVVEAKHTQEEINSIGQDISELDSTIQTKISTALEGSSADGFKYFNKNDLETLGVADVDREVIINFTTKEVVDINGVKSEGNYIYRLKGWNNVEYQNKNTEAPEFSLTKKVYGLNATVQVADIVYKGNVAKGQVSYCLLNDDGTEGNWKTASGQEFSVEQSGIYKVMLTDSAGNSTDGKTIEVVLANKPKLDSGMTPVVYDSTLGKWKKIEENSGEWYDYASDKKQWANVMLQDGLVVNADGTIDNDKMGSMFVWVPRYMYQIPVANYHTSNAGEIQIKFLRETTNIATDATNIDIANESGGDNWNVHPAFCDGTKNNFANGEWDKDITGIWVAKFEASSTNESDYANYGGGNKTSLDVKVLPNVNSWRYISVSNIYKVCKNMTKTSNIYNLSTNSNSHMMKNSEWGAVTYLTQSCYGNPQTAEDANSGVWNSNYHNGDEYHTSKTGVVGNIRDAITADGTTNASYYEYNTENGNKGSTTRNVYGIYDMSGGAWEFTAAYLANETNYYVNLFENNKPKESERQTYSQGNEDTSLINYVTNFNRYGDALHETGKEDLSLKWNNDFLGFVTVEKSFFMRGGGFHIKEESGIFAASCGARCFK